MDTSTLTTVKQNIRKLKKEKTEIRDGEIQTACQSACPTEAIVFGNINDPQSRVSQLKRNTRNYSLLSELNTKPRTTYLAIVRNPNPALEPSGPSQKPQAEHGAGEHES